MRQSFRTTVALVVLCTACERLQDDPIFAYGRAEQRDGSPLAGATLSYERAKVINPPNSGGPPEPFPEPEWEPYGTATTEASGDYFLEMRYGDVQAPEPNSAIPDATRPYRYRVSYREEDGAGTFVSFLFADDVELPTLRVWDSHLALDASPGGPVVSFQPPPPVPEVPVTGEVVNTSNEAGEVVPDLPSTPVAVLNVTSGGKSLFRWWGAPSPWVASPYVMEDFEAPEVGLRAFTLGEWWFFPLGGKRTFMEFRQEWRTPVLPMPRGNLRPVSRGAVCEPAPEGACPWTDGKLDVVHRGNGAASALTVTLPEPVRLRHAVVRGMTAAAGDHFRLEGSADGETWSVLAISPLRVSDHASYLELLNRRRFADMTRHDSPFDGPLYEFDAMGFGEAPLEDVGPVRYVRLFSASYLNGNNGIPRGFYTLSELSLFE